MSTRNQRKYALNHKAAIDRIDELESTAARETMRDRGFGFKAENQAETVTVKIQVHWGKSVSLDELTETLTQAYAEAFSRATDVHSA